jgi:membrane-associated phospholipid phosphatase
VAQPSNRVWRGGSALRRRRVECDRQSAGRMTAGVPRRSVAFGLALAVVGVVLFAADYVVALGTRAGRAFDRHALISMGSGAELPNLTALGVHVVNTIDIGSIALVATAIVVQALARRRPRKAVEALVIIGGAIATSEALKPLLGTLDPLGGEAGRSIASSFPSGHATVAASIGFAAIVAAPARYRPAAALAAAAYAAAVGVALVEIGSHYPSDVLGGFLVALVWTAVVTAAGRVSAPGRAPEAVVQTAVTLAVLAAGGAFAAVLAVTFYRHPSVFTRGPLRGDFFAAAGGIVAASLLSALAVFMLCAHRAGELDAELHVGRVGSTVS